MSKYVCGVCGYVYDPVKGDPENGIAPGTKFEDLPDNWECPVCGASKNDFEKEQVVSWIPHPGVRYKQMNQKPYQPM